MPAVSNTNGNEIYNYSVEFIFKNIYQEPTLSSVQVEWKQASLFEVTPQMSSEREHL